MPPLRHPETVGAVLPPHFQVLAVHLRLKFHHPAVLIVDLFRSYQPGTLDRLELEVDQGVDLRRIDLLAGEIGAVEDIPILVYRIEGVTPAADLVDLHWRAQDRSLEMIAGVRLLPLNLRPGPGLRSDAEIGLDLKAVAPGLLGFGHGLRDQQYRVHLGHRPEDQETGAAENDYQANQPCQPPGL